MPRYEALPVDNNFDLGDASDSDNEDQPDNTHTHTSRRQPRSSERPSSPVHHPLLGDSSSAPSSPTASASASGSRSQPLSIALPQRQDAEVIFSLPDADVEASAEDDSYMQPPPTPPGGFHYPPPPGNPPVVPGNSNGVPIPADFHPPSPPRRSLLTRALGVIVPGAYRPQSMRIVHPQGGGTGNDGVFANMSAKPDTRGPGMRRGLNEEGENPDWVPEIASNQPPPSYLAAQADAVPPYYEAALGSGGSPFTGPISPNASLLIDNLPPGSIFSFLWNLLVSLSFQFVGFLLTYLLHTSHAAKQGSRAGLGITLIQYGFYLRQRADTLAQGTIDSNGMWHFPSDPSDPTSTPVADPTPSFSTAAEADAYYRTHNDTLPSSPPSLPFGDGSMPTAMLPHELSVANEWLSFFLMTIGWFVLLTSVLSFWRVKRWERNVRRQAEERAREEAAALESVEGGAAGSSSSSSSSAAAGTSSSSASSAPNAEPERRRMALDLHSLLERVGRAGRVGRARTILRFGGARSERAGAGAGRAAGERNEESVRLEAVD